MSRILYKLRNRFKSQRGVSDSHLQVNKVFHVGQGGPQQKIDQLHVPLLYSQMQHSFVTFKFLELKKRHKLGIKLNPQDLWHH